MSDILNRRADLLYYVLRNSHQFAALSHGIQRNATQNSENFSAESCGPYRSAILMDKILAGIHIDHCMATWHSMCYTSAVTSTAWGQLPGVPNNLC